MSAGDVLRLEVSADAPVITRTIEGLAFERSFRLVTVEADLISGPSVESVSRHLASLAVVHMGQTHERFRDGTADRGGQLIQVVRAICATDCECLSLLASIVAATLHTQG